MNLTSLKVGPIYKHRKKIIKWRQHIIPSWRWILELGQQSKGQTAEKEMKLELADVLRLFFGLNKTPSKHYNVSTIFFFGYKNLPCQLTISSVCPHNHAAIFQSFFVWIPKRAMLIEDNFLFVFRTIVLTSRLELCTGFKQGNGSGVTDIHI